MLLRSHRRREPVPLATMRRTSGRGLGFGGVRLGLAFAFAACQLLVMSTAVGATPEPGSLKLYPITLRSQADRYLMPASGSTAPYFVLRAEPSAPEMRRVWSLALDYGGPVLAAVDPGDPKRIVALRLALPEDQVVKWRCRDASRLTREFWAGKAPMANEKTDYVLWVAREPGCRVHLVHLQNHDGPYYLDENHPDAAGMMQRAQESIDLERTVRWSRCEGMFDFICSLDMATRHRASERDTLPETQPGAWPPAEDVWGDVKRLSQSEARFVEYWRTIERVAEAQGVPFTYLTPEVTEREWATGTLATSNRTLRVIEGFSVTQDPGGTGALEVSFYKTDAGEYFYRQTGGCIAARDLLFGPFRESAAGFSAGR